MIFPSSVCGVFPHVVVSDGIQTSGLGTVELDWISSAQLVGSWACHGWSDGGDMQHAALRSENPQSVA